MVNQTDTCVPSRRWRPSSEQGSLVPLTLEEINAALPLPPANTPLAHWPRSWEQRAKASRELAWRNGYRLEDAILATRPRGVAEDAVGDRVLSIVSGRWRQMWEMAPRPFTVARMVGRLERWWPSYRRRALAENGGRLSDTWQAAETELKTTVDWEPQSVEIAAAVAVWVARLREQEPRVPLTSGEEETRRDEDTMARAAAPEVARLADVPRRVVYEALGGYLKHWSDLPIDGNPFGVMALAESGLSYYPSGDRLTRAERPAVAQAIIRAVRTYERARGEVDATCPRLGFDIRYRRPWGWGYHEAMAAVFPGRLRLSAEGSGRRRRFTLTCPSWRAPVVMTRREFCCYRRSARAIERQAGIAIDSALWRTVWEGLELHKALLATLRTTEPCLTG